VTHEELVDECAKEAFESHVSLGNGGPSSWGSLPPAVKEFWRNSLRSALAVVWREMQKVTPEMEDAAIRARQSWGARMASDYLAMLRASPLNPGE